MSRLLPAPHLAGSLFAGMRISHRLLLGFGGLLLLALGIGLGTLVRMDQLDRLTRTSYEQPFAAAEHALEALQTVERIRRLDRDAVVEPNLTRRAVLASQTVELDSQFMQQLQTLRGET